MHAGSSTFGKYLVSRMFFSISAVGAAEGVEALPRQWLSQRGNIVDQNWRGNSCMVWNSANVEGSDWGAVVAHGSQETHLHVNPHTLSAVCGLDASPVDGGWEVQGVEFGRVH